jgi:uncharacterized protein (AIM24 family)
MQENMSVLNSLERGNIKIEILQYNNLNGGDNIAIAEQLFFAQQAGIRLKQVKVTLNNGSIIIEAGAMHFMRGRIEMDNKVGGVGGLAKKVASSVLTKETAFKPKYTGTGELYLEPNFGHYIMVELKNEEMIVDKGLFYCCEPSVDVGVVAQKNLSSATLGGEGLFQTRLKGTGFCVLAIPVPECELIKCTLNNEKLMVDGNFALLRKGDIQFTVERTSKTLFDSWTSGEGLAQTFRGTGEVWLAPTQSIYHRIIRQGIYQLSKATGSSHTST